IYLPRTSRQQFGEGEAVPKGEWKQGDLLFFTTKQRREKNGIEKVGHVAVYIGDNRILHTYRPARKVSVSSLEGYWNKVYLGARRILS
ncbi:MAG TPA: NlpC/P60 family protein, partial [Bacillales bacterium]|nr:NlpC/P60 family protein [Bacillales bacterium]